MEVTLASDGTLLEMADNRIWTSLVKEVKCISAKKSLEISQDVGVGTWQGTAVVTSAEPGYAFIEKTGYLIPVWKITGELEGINENYAWNPVIDAVK
ncbi:hypothetical protein [Lactimicrobium sp.]|uniref:hypothetical protein n=1 Tax=Lactimicrobium sp. TaxID=2563780 RepID=UPI002F35E0C5